METTDQLLRLKIEKLTRWKSARAAVLVLPKREIVDFLIELLVEHHGHVDKIVRSGRRARLPRGVLRPAIVQAFVQVANNPLTTKQLFLDVEAKLPNLTVKSLVNEAVRMRKASLLEPAGPGARGGHFRLTAAGLALGGAAPP